MNLGIITARGGSKGLPGKNIRQLGGRPLIVHTVDAAKKSRLLGDYLVSTDDPAIAEVARSAGAAVPFIRPSEMATDEVSIWAAVLHATEEWEKINRRTADTVVLLQPTSPLRTAEDIDGCIRRFRELSAELCLSVVASHDSPYFNMVEPDLASSGFVRPCSPLMKDHSRRQEALPVFSVNGAIYVVQRSVLSGLQNQFCLERIAAYEMPRLRSVDIDVLEDLELAEWVLSRSGSKDGSKSRQVACERTNNSSA